MKLEKDFNHREHGEYIEPREHREEILLFRKSVVYCVLCVVSVFSVLNLPAQAPTSAALATDLVVANASATGTTVNTLTKLTGAPSAAVIAATGDNKSGVIIGITVSGAGATGNATIANQGTVLCVFDNATTAGDFVTVSTGTAGDCHDSGATQPLDGSQTVGRVLSTNAGAGTYNVALGNFSNSLNTVALAVSCGTVAANGACANTATGGTFHAIFGNATLASNTSTITGISPAFTSSSTFFCVANDTTTRANPVQAVPASGTTVTFTNTTGATDNIEFICAGY